MTCTMEVVPRVSRPDRTPHQLRLVRHLLSVESRWLKPQPQYPWKPHWLAFDQNAMACRPTSPRAKSWTLRGAIYAAAVYHTGDRYKRLLAIRMMESAVISVLVGCMGKPGIDGFNNHENTNHASLMALLDDAIDDAEAQTT